MNSGGHTRSGLLALTAGAGWKVLGQVADLKAVVAIESSWATVALVGCAGVLYVLCDRVVGGSLSDGIIRFVPEKWHPAFLPVYFVLSFGAGLTALVAVMAHPQSHTPGLWVLLPLTGISVVAATQLLRHALRLKHAVSGYSGLALGLAGVVEDAEDEAENVAARFQALCAAINQAMLAVTRPFSARIVLSSAVYEPDYERLTFRCLGLAASDSAAQAAADSSPPELPLIKPQGDRWVHGSAAAQVFLSGDVESHRREHGVYSLTPSDASSWVSEWDLLGLRDLDSEQFESTPIRVGSVPVGLIGTFSSLARYYDVLHRSMLLVGATWAERLWPDGTSTLYAAASQKAYSETARLARGARQPDVRSISEIGKLIRLWRDYRYRPETFTFIDLDQRKPIATHVSASGVATLRNLAVRVGLSPELDAELWALHLHYVLSLSGNHNAVVWIEPSTCSEKGVRLLQDVLTIVRQPCPSIRIRATDLVRSEEGLERYAEILEELGAKAVIEVDSIDELALFEGQTRIRLERVDCFSLSRSSWIPLLKTNGAARAIRMGEVPLVAKELHDPAEEAQLKKAGFLHAEVRKKWH